MNAQDYREVGRLANGCPMARTFLLHWIGKLVGIQFKIGGWPYGASRSRAINRPEGWADVGVACPDESSPA